MRTHWEELEDAAVDVAVALVALAKHGGGGGAMEAFGGGGVGFKT